MKKILIGLLMFFAVHASGQIAPGLHTVLNKPIVISTTAGGPLDALSQYYDATNFVYRDYQSTTEVQTYLSASKWRVGNHTVFIHVGGTLNSNGTYTGGATKFYIWANGIGNGNLIPFADFLLSGYSLVSTVVKNAGGDSLIVTDLSGTRLAYALAQGLQATTLVGNTTTLGITINDATDINTHIPLAINGIPGQDRLFRVRSDGADVIYASPTEFVSIARVTALNGLGINGEISNSQNSTSNINFRYNIIGGGNSNTNGYVSVTDDQTGLPVLNLNATRLNTRALQTSVPIGLTAGIWRLGSGSDSLITVEVDGVAHGINTTNVTHLKISIADFIVGETPAGLVNSTNVTYTLANTPIPNKEIIYLNGARQKRLVDYTISGATITFINPPGTGLSLLADYLK